MSMMIGSVVDCMLMVRFLMMFVVEFVLLVLVMF